MSEWISVKDRLPEEEGFYLVSGRTASNHYLKVWEAWFTHIGPLKGWLNNATNPPIEYWMPLPEPPKEGEDGD